ncbi:CA-responsive protein [Trema orientale]|uniref:CA-responsive protein n=1 Tax=Trema orientale TaxID=63057 RepID=A0A2P5FEC3_TREOI|nr:CA-responsive protein [Trema orientale]
MFSICFFLFLSTFSVFVFSFSVYRRFKKKTEQPQHTHQTQNPTQTDPLGLEASLSENNGETRPTGESNSAQLTHSARSLLLEILPSDSPKWESLFENQGSGDPDSAGSGFDGERGDSGGDQRGKKKKKRSKKKSSNSKGEDNGEEGCGLDKGNSGPGSRVKQDLVCLYPFTSSSSVTQRKIKQQYDELMKCHQSKGLTLAQVGEFANCLVEAKNELQHKADVIQRKFTITKALLCKADRSSFDRLRQQIYKLELEQKRLEEDAVVYNWLQQQLKLSPAYKKMLEIGARMELKAKSGELMESTDTEYSDISFEELLAQEKKDSFWLAEKWEIETMLKLIRVTC